MTTMTLPKSLTELLRLRATSDLEKVAYVFLSGPPDEEKKETITYAELDITARRVTALLQKQTIRAGERVLLLCQPGLDYISGFFGCLYAGVVAVPVFPPRNRQHAMRIVDIIGNAGATVILCTSSDIARCKRLLQDTAAADIVVLDLGDAKSVNPALSLHDAAPAQIAFLQYTSGTTGSPKGVMVTHGSVMHNLALISQWLNHHAHSTMVGWLPPYHDMGLIGMILSPVYGGYRCVLMAPERFIQHPFLWLRAISDYGADITGAPDFAYSICCRRVSEEQLRTLDLSSLKTTFNGAETVRLSTLSRFSKRFMAAHFNPGSLTPCYGLAEATLLVTGRRERQPVRILSVDMAALQRQQLLIKHVYEDLPLNVQGCRDHRELVSVGPAIGEQQVMVRDVQTSQPCCDDVIGEICVAGQSVTSGYWQQYEQTIAVFQQSLTGISGHHFVGTGDLGFFHQGELYITGRLKDMIIIAGRNHYSEDIEHTVLSSLSLLVPNGCAAFTIESGVAEQLVIVAEVERTQRKGDFTAAFNTIYQAIWSCHDLSPVAVLLVSAGTVPKTSSGKVRRSECRTRMRENGLKILAQRGLVEMTTAAPASNISPVAVASSLLPAPGQIQQTSHVAKVEQLNDWLRHYARTRIDSRTIDERRTIPPHIVLDFGNQGLLGMQIGPEYGGLGLSHWEMLQVVSQLATIDLTLTFFVGLNNTLGIRPILLHAQSALREALLPQLASGRMLAAFALTESSAGSNPRAMAATAQRSEEYGWVLNGQKIWSGSSAWAGVINIFAKQSDGSGIVGLAVPQGTPGLRIGAEDLTMGVRGMIQNTLHLNQARVSDACRLGEPGHGMEIAQQTMNFTRLGIGAIGVGGMKRCAQLMHRYGQQRRISTGLLLDHPLTRLRLGEIRHRIEGLQALVEKLAIDLDAGHTVSEDSLLIVKILGSELLSSSTDELMQVLGGRGYIETNLVPQMFRDARLPRIFEGPTETLLSYLGSRLLNQSDDLIDYLKTHLGASALAADIRQIGEQLHEDGLRNQALLGGAVHATHWVNYWLGTVAQWALLLAAVEQTTGLRGMDSTTIQWARSQYELAIETAQRQAGRRRALLNTSQLNDWAEHVSQEIGPIEQTASAATQQLEPLLCAVMRDAQLVASALPDDTDKAPAPIAASAAVNVAFRQKLQQWLFAWLVEHMRHGQIALSEATTFAEIGLDSILSIELTMDFKEAFGITLDASVIWDYPSIGLLINSIDNLVKPSSSN